MNIQGIKFWESPEIRYDQTENAVENIIRKINLENGVKKGYLESCGASACACIIEGLGKIGKTPVTHTGKSIQFDDFIMNYLNDPRNKFLRDNEMCNRLFRNYVRLTEELFGVRAEILNIFNFQNFKDIIRQGNGIQFCLIEPGHFLAAIASDGENVIYNDSWSTRPGLKNKGLHEILTEKDFIENVIKTVIVYYKD